MCVIVAKVLWYCIIKLISILVIFKYDIRKLLLFQQ
jgi:hypothetical protein